MVVHFFLRYKTAYGQSIAIIGEPDALPGAEAQARELPLQYYNEEYWHGSFDRSEVSLEEQFVYRYVVRETGKPDIQDLAAPRILHFKKIDAKELKILDDWQQYSYLKTVFSTRPFNNLFGHKKIKLKDPDSKAPTHIFEVKAGQLPEDHILCITGEGKKLGEWDEVNPLFFKRKQHSWVIKLNLSKEKSPLAYKFGLYNTRLKKMVAFEPGENRRLVEKAGKSTLLLLHQFVHFPGHDWKGAGVNVQLSSLRTASSWGIGDFTDLTALTDWAADCGFKMVQLLPINDTTAYHDRRDSYPYSAISAFAQHPIFLNVQKLATAVSLEFADETLDEIRSLNDLPTLDYDRVWQIKKEAIRELYEKDRHSFKDDFGYFDFFDLNRDWLVPYAVFCYLRDKYGTADFSQWPELSRFDEAEVQAFASPGTEQYDDIAIHYFTQYHLHLQLLDVVDHAHKRSIILKGDLPIGVGRYSVDTWMHPQLFHMDMQAGAPPDAFAVKGQNWSFPTYNWQKMQESGYSWWRQRMEHLSNYFDAVRIDHVLGFFRIWSIPLHAVDGIFGRFMPVHPLFPYDFEMAGLNFNADRLAKPWITDEILIIAFGNDASWVKETLLDGFSFKAEFDTQRKLLSYFEKHEHNKHLLPGLLNLLTNIILLRDETNANQFHFRIDMQSTSSFKSLSGHEQHLLDKLYHKYFFETQNGLWHREAQGKLDAIQKSTEMIICAEDLGMVPEMVEEVLKTREILALQVQRMPKAASEKYADPGKAPYLSVVTPSTHDMSTIREWWEEDPPNSGLFYRQNLGLSGEVPFYCEPWICRKIIEQHMHSPAMWSVFLLQDLMAMSASLRRENPREERINLPADPNHYWNYRMHLKIEELQSDEDFTASLHELVASSGR